MGCALDQDNVIDHDKTHDEAMTENDDEPQDKSSSSERASDKGNTNWIADARLTLQTQTLSHDDDGGRRLLVVVILVETYPTSVFTRVIEMGAERALMRQFRK